MVWKAYAVLIEAKKRYDVLAWIKEGTQSFGNINKMHGIPAGVAVRLDLGDGRAEDRTEQENAWFPADVARSGVKVSVQTANASRELDKANILRILSNTTDPAIEPPESCDGYDRVNVALRGFFRGPALWVMADDGDTDGLVRLLATQHR